MDNYSIDCKITDKFVSRDRLPTYGWRFLRFGKNFTYGMLQLFWKVLSGKIYNLKYKITYELR